MTKLKKHINSVLRLIIIVASLFYAFWGINLSQLLKIIVSYDIIPLISVVLFSMVSYLVLSYRLHFLIDFKTNIGVCFKASVLGLAVNNLLPAKLGEIAKMLYLKVHGKVPFAFALSVVFWERFFDLNILLLLMLYTVYSFDLKLIVIPLAAGVLSIWALLIIALILPGLFEKLIDILPFTRIKETAHSSFSSICENFKTQKLVFLFINTVLVWVFYASLGLMSFIWVAKLNLNISQALAVFIISSVGMALPSSPGAIGVYEAAIVFGLNLFGIEKEQALAAALVLHMIQYIPVTLMGLFILTKSGIKISEFTKQKVNENI